MFKIKKTHNCDLQHPTLFLCYVRFIDHISCYYNQVTTGNQAMQWLLSSERVFRDLLAAEEHTSVTNVVVRCVCSLYNMLLLD